MKDKTENYIDHEVRIRLQEAKYLELGRIFTSIDGRFDKIEATIASNFHWTIGVMSTFFVTMLALFATVILHSANLI
ncbi:MAG TPA: hypothetical protein VK553_12175 [Candidatus Nitrosopolaris rasttigaisensis]|nr:hypothetical protein [Candidatus Nitrosopolaris rasttigaisensis]